jgi:septal ring factor EnvC (AmiA/AmiB activator)
MGEEMRSGDANERALKQLEKEVVYLERQQTELIRKKWALEDKIREQEMLIKHLKHEEGESKRGLSMWKRVALVLGVAWGIVLSLFGIDRK